MSDQSFPVAIRQENANNFWSFPQLSSMYPRNTTNILAGSWATMRGADASAPRIVAQLPARMFVVLRGYMDESCGKDQKLFAFSCLMATGKDWSDMERSWNLH